MFFKLQINSFLYNSVQWSLVEEHTCLQGGGGTWIATFGNFTISVFYYVWVFSDRKQPPPPSTSSRFVHGNIKSFCMTHVYEKTSLPPKSVLCEFESPTSSLAQRGAVLIKKKQKSLHRSTNFSIKIRETPLDLTSKAKFKLTILCIIYRMCQNVFTN